VLCPVCRSASTKVLDSRDGRDGSSVRRRRSCNACGHRFTTHERIEETLPVVIKRDGSKQAFDREKLLRGLQLACRKRPVRRDRLEAIVQQLEQWSSTRGDRELHAAEIGERVMHLLYELDEVAYVRFVSVYRSFESVAEFSELLREMEKAERVDPEGQRTLFPQSGPLPLPTSEAARRPRGRDDGAAHPGLADDASEAFADGRRRAVLVDDDIDDERLGAHDELPPAPGERDDDA
jgi:transcriptional repressor NrdR